MSAKDGSLYRDCIEIKEFARILEVDRSTVSRWTNSDKLPVIRIGGRKILHIEDCIAFIQEPNVVTIRDWRSGNDREEISCKLRKIWQARLKDGKISGEVEEQDRQQASRFSLEQYLSPEDIESLWRACCELVILAAESGKEQYPALISDLMCVISNLLFNTYDGAVNSLRIMCRNFQK
jgi:hypothetical protein